MKNLIHIATLGLLLHLAPVASSASQEPAQFEVSVTGKPGKDNAIILIPGLASPGAVWDSTVDHLCRRGSYRCHVVSLAGFGGKPAVAAPSLDTVTRQLAGYIRREKLSQPVLIGHSLGGFLALRVASAEPALVGRVVAVDSLPAMGAAQAPMLSAAQLREGAERRRTEMLAQTPQAYDAVGAMIAPTMATSPEDVQKVLGWTKGSDRASVAHAMADMLGTDLREEVARIRVPVLVLGTWIAYRPYATRETVEATFRDQYRKLPDVQIEITDNARHFIMLDDPAWMFARIDRFLARNATPSATQSAAP